MAALVAALCLLPDESVDSALRLSASVSYWHARPRGRSAVDELLGASPPGSEKEAPRLSLARDGGLDDRDGIIEFTLRAVGRESGSGFDMGPRLAFGNGRFTSRGSLEEEEDLGSLLIPAGAPFSSKLLYRSAELGWVMVAPPWGLDDSSLQAEGRAGLRFLQAKLDWDIPQGAVDADAGALGFTLGGRLRLEKDPVFAALEADVLLPGFGGAWIAELEAEAGVAFGPLRLKAGYRRLWADENVNDSFRLSLDGFTAGAEVSLAF